MVGRLLYPNFDCFVRRRDWFNALVKIPKSDRAFGTCKRKKGIVMMAMMILMVVVEMMIMVVEMMMMITIIKTY